MPPPKAKLHKNTGRLKNINSTRVDSSVRPPQSNTSTNNSNHLNNPNNANSRASSQNSNNARNDVPAIQTNPMESPAIEQFELELYWCIQTLENSLGSGKLNAKQVQDTEKTLRSLKSSSQPMVKKRQLMQSAFGDYRKKMADEEKKLRVGNTTIQFVGATSKEQSTLENKSHFVKKSLTSTLGATNFQFNFPIDAMEKLSIEKSAPECDSTSPPTTSNVKAEPEMSTSNGNECSSDNKLDASIAPHPNPFIKSKFTTSDNSFKFNFAIECD